MSHRRIGSLVRVVLGPVVVVVLSGGCGKGPQSPESPSADGSSPGIPGLESKIRYGARDEAMTATGQLLRPTLGSEGNQKESFCSGVLVAPNVVVTADHCLDSIGGTGKVDQLTFAGAGTSPTTEYPVKEAKRLLPVDLALLRLG